MSVVNIPKQALRALQRAQWVRNAKLADANLYSQLTGQLNHASRWRGKQLFLGVVPIASVPVSSDLLRLRWYGMAHTSPFCRYLWARVVAAPTSKTNQSITILTSTGENFVFNVGSAGGSPTDVPSNFVVMQSPLCYASTATPYDMFTEGFADSDMFFIVEETKARIMSVSIYEECTASKTENNYAPDAFALSQPILDSHRSVLTQNARTMYKRQTSHLYTFTVEGTARSRTSATPINVVDNTSTAVSAATPGVTLDLTNRSTQRRVTVPCVLSVYGTTTAGGTGTVLLKDSGGATVATVTITSTVFAITTVVANLPATNAKYDIQYAGDGTHQVGVAAVSLYRHT